MTYHQHTRKCDGMCDICDCPESVRLPIKADARKPCTCDGAGRGPGRACVVKTGGRLGALWRCAEGCNGCDDCTDYES